MAPQRGRIAEPAVGVMEAAVAAVVVTVGVEPTARGTLVVVAVVGVVLAGSAAAGSAVVARAARVAASGGG